MLRQGHFELAHSAEKDGRSELQNTSCPYLQPKQLIRMTDLNCIGIHKWSSLQVRRHKKGLCAQICCPDGLPVNTYNADKAFWHVLTLQQEDEHPPTMTLIILQAHKGKQKLSSALEDAAPVTEPHQLCNYGSLPCAKFSR